MSKLPLPEGLKIGAQRNWVDQELFTYTWDQFPGPARSVIIAVRSIDARSGGMRTDVEYIDLPADISIGRATICIEEFLLEQCQIDHGFAEFWIAPTTAVLGPAERMSLQIITGLNGIEQMFHVKLDDSARHRLLKKALLPKRGIIELPATSSSDTTNQTGTTNGNGHTFMGDIIQACRSRFQKLSSVFTRTRDTAGAHEGTVESITKQTTHTTNISAATADADNLDRKNEIMNGNGNENAVGQNEPIENNGKPVCRREGATLIITVGPNVADYLVQPFAKHNKSGSRYVVGIPYIVSSRQKMLIAGENITIEIKNIEFNPTHPEWSISYELEVRAKRTDATFSSPTIIPIGGTELMAICDKTLPNKPADQPKAEEPKVIPPVPSPAPTPAPLPPVDKTDDEKLVEQQKARLSKIISDLSNNPTWDMLADMDIALEDIWHCLTPVAALPIAATLSAEVNATYKRVNARQLSLCNKLPIYENNLAVCRNLIDRLGPNAGQPGFEFVAEFNQITRTAPENLRDLYAALTKSKALLASIEKKVQEVTKAAIDESAAQAKTEADAKAKAEEDAAESAKLDTAAILAAEEKLKIETRQKELEQQLAEANARAEQSAKDAEKMAKEKEEESRARTAAEEALNKIEADKEAERARVTPPANTPPPTPPTPPNTSDAQPAPAGDPKKSWWQKWRKRIDVISALLAIIAASVTITKYIRDLEKSEKILSNPVLTIPVLGSTNDISYQKLKVLAAKVEVERREREALQTEEKILSNGLQKENERITAELEKTKAMMADYHQIATRYETTNEELMKMVKEKGVTIPALPPGTTISVASNSNSGTVGITGNGYVVNSHVTINSNVYIYPPASPAHKAKEKEVEYEKPPGLPPNAQLGADGKWRWDVVLHAGESYKFTNNHKWSSACSWKADSRYFTAEHKVGDTWQVVKHDAVTTDSYPERRYSLKSDSPDTAELSFTLSPR